MGFLKRLVGLSTTEKAVEGWRVVDGSVELDLDRVPALARAGGAVRLEGGGLERRLMVLHGLDGLFRAYVNTCACSGWRIDPVEGEHKVRCCTLAASTYDYDGKRVSGPAKDDLQTLAVDRAGERLRIRLS